MKYTSFNKNVVVALTALLICLSQVLSASNRTSIAGIPQNDTISAAWEELTSGDFVKAVKLSQGVCIIPMGVIEKHGQQLPLGTDVYTARELALRAATMEYAVVFPKPSLHRRMIILYSSTPLKWTKRFRIKSTPSGATP